MLTFKKILTPVDNSEHSKRAFHYALGLAQTQKAHIALLHCYGRIPMLVGGAAKKDVVAEYTRKAEELLIPYVQRLQEIGLEPALVIREGSPGEAIVQELEAGAYDLVVMGSRGLSDIQGVIMGSTAHYVMSEAACPVLIVR